MEIIEKISINSFNYIFNDIRSPRDGMGWGGGTVIESHLIRFPGHGGIGYRGQSASLPWEVRPDKLPHINFLIKIVTSFLYKQIIANGTNAMEGKLKKSLRQRRNYAAGRVCRAIDRLLAATSKEEKAQATQWVAVWKKQLAKL